MIPLKNDRLVCVEQSAMSILIFVQFVNIMILYSMIISNQMFLQHHNQNDISIDTK